MMETMESTVTVEKQLQESGTAMIERAKTMVITSHDDYEEAGKALVEIKTRMKQVTDYWKEPKAQAASAHKTICNKEKEMLSPLNEAEKIIKNAMVLYQSAVEKARREAEEEARRQKQAEAERLLAEAMKAEEKGDDQKVKACCDRLDEIKNQMDKYRFTADEIDHIMAAYNSNDEDK